MDCILELLLAGTTLVEVPGDHVPSPPLLAFQQSSGVTLFGGEGVHKLSGQRFAGLTINYY